MALDPVKYPPYVGIQKEELSCFGHLKGMLVRVFLPGRAPLLCEMNIETNMGLGMLGRDAKFEFHKHIQSPDGKAISRGQSDFYVTPRMTQIEASCPRVIAIIEFVLKKIFFFLQGAAPSLSLLPEKLPSYLFYGAKENDRISFLYDNRPVELTLKQHDNRRAEGKLDFEKFFNTIPVTLGIGIEEGVGSYYLYDVDAGENDLILKVGASWRKLGPNAVVKTFPNEVKPVTKEDVHSFNQFVEKACPFSTVVLKVEKEFTVCLEAFRMQPENFKAIIDGRFVTLIGSVKMDHGIKGVTRCISTIAGKVTDHGTGPVMINQFVDLKTIECDSKNLTLSKSKGFIFVSGLTFKE